ncbi:hydantoinase/oxoprolinase N-terminal domain-containing protein [Methanimicrococcus blatticola]|uniref:N-methylhydantoinase A/oxoprolinase/acetone carboxylase beta subunit n=1 Tax=Methanimicrococcus blatticola TaxID=91560 RepID=A0A484F4M9_9EURY|nr:hydantoinase/oxoprolinase family protein [Methanimicrococcus blatticola]MBZ3936371.1 hydantoinase/oxoprolinase family protein [Methanimicrococcus blatticola]MCC2509533.1 hydantoinase/oxoprolinase family protein [Methanimicrococcus blatticola]TDQ67589.1 N-methylhydantoinase A/oxoprolinase/acetone carboxylase beta subunit [Methanimicrococcus blatticola]
MTLCLGIDTGGTYTDVVIIDDESKTVLKSAKSLTTYPDPIDGIRNALDEMPADLIEKVSVVSVSTTLSTNTVLENTGEAAALILIGSAKLLNFDDQKAVQNYTIVSGGHDNEGNEAEPLDFEAIEEYVLSVKDKVSAFAVSSYFSVRNPDHELQTKELIQRLTVADGQSGHPVVCGHELAQSLGTYERGVTAYLNAMLLPTTNRFVNAVVSEVKRRGLNADIKILKCNGAVSGIEEAMEKPVESIFSGPAASLLGASFLSGRESCLMIDVGGTSTDVSLVENGFPDISDNGAVVGGWRTKVRAIRMETSALGGDSQIWIRLPSLSDSAVQDRIMFGPRRIIPICRAASLYPEILESLKERWFADKYRFSEYVQPVRFYIRSGNLAIGLTAEEQKVYNKIKEDAPVSINDIMWDMTYVPADILKSLVTQKLINMIGFTPTDVLHVLGDYNEFNAEASVLAARITASFLDTEYMELCRYLKQTFSLKMAQELVYFLVDKGLADNAENIVQTSRSDVFNTRSRFEASFNPDLTDSPVFKDSVKAVLAFKKPLLKYKLDIPVVMIGGPVKAFADDLRQFIDAEILTPEYFDVGNAVGALVGKIAKRIDISVRTVQSESRYMLKTNGFIVYYPGGRQAFANRDDALNYARELGKQMIMEYMEREAVPAEKVEFKMHEEDVSISKGVLPYMTHFVFEGFARNVL